MHEVEHQSAPETKPGLQPGDPVRVKIWKKDRYGKRVLKGAERTRVYRLDPDPKFIWIGAGWKPRRVPIEDVEALPKDALVSLPRTHSAVFFPKRQRPPKSIPAKGVMRR